MFFVIWRCAAPPNNKKNSMPLFIEKILINLCSTPIPRPVDAILIARNSLRGDYSSQVATYQKIGDEVRIADAAGYTMVKKNWFNGVVMPSIAVRRLNGTVELVRSFGYQDYLSNLS